MPKYLVSGLPPVTERGTSAFLPHFNFMAASGTWQYKDGVHGYPGTKTIPVDMTQAAQVPVTPGVFRSAATPGTVALALKGQAASPDAPQAFWPNLYYAYPERNYRPGLMVQMYDPTAPELTTMIPVPAVSYRQTYQRKAATLSMGVTGTGTDPQGGKQARQPVSQLIGWARRTVGNGLPVPNG